MAGQKEISVGVKFTGDAAGFQKTIGDVKRSVGDVTKNITKFSAGFLSVGAAIEVARRAMNSTDASADKLDKIIGTLDGSMQGLFRTIVTGDWDQLIGNIVNTAKATRDLRGALQELGDIEASNTIRKGFLGRELQGAKLGAAGTDDPRQKAEYIQQAITAQKALTSIEVEEIASRLKATEDFFTTRMQWTDEEAKYNIDALRKIAGNYKYFYGEGSIAIEGLKERVKELTYFSTSQWKGLTDVQKEELRTLKLTLGSLEIFKDLQDSMKPDEFQNYIKGIGEYFSAIASGDQDLIKLTKSLTTVSEKLKEIDRIQSVSKAGGHPGSSKSLLPAMIGTQTNNKLAGSSIGSPDELVTSLQLAQNAVNALDSTFQSMFTNIAGGFRGMIDALMSSINMLLGQLIAKAAIFGILQLLFPGSGAAVSALSGLRKFVGIPGFAGGTNFAPGGLALVGEKGPELVNLPRGSQVIPRTGQSMKVEVVGKVRGRDLALILTRYQSELTSNT